ncbi:unnamed protein product [Clavelina lepadiformis]|uniref:Uncharacterized protein n=1 Tax=Clavelina lepadiformis TaxID=159417 RepID=A0ABP0GV75_CLALP
MAALDLSANKFDEEGAIAIPQCIKNIKALTALNCQISLSGLRIITRQIIQVLNLQNNAFGDEGAPFLAYCLSNILSFHIGSCNITAKADTQLANAISCLTCECHIEGKGVIEMVKSIKALLSENQFNLYSILRPVLIAQAVQNGMGRNSKLFAYTLSDLWRICSSDL